MRVYESPQNLVVVAASFTSPTNQINSDIKNILGHTLSQ